MVNIEEEMENSEENYDWLHILRVEQLYPFPKKDLLEELKQLPNLEEIVWVQEEPQNMGAWDFVDDYLRDMLEDGQKLRVISRPKRSAPAGGIPSIHKTTQSNIIRQALSKN